MQKKISVVIPVFRNEGSIRLTYEKVSNQIKTLGYNYEFVFVDDGSDDGSLNELIDIHNADNKVKVLTLSRNFGQVAAVIAGNREVTGDAVIGMSADLQEPIELIKTMIEHWETGSEVVLCQRIDREDGMVANLSSSFFYRLMKIANPRMPKGGFDFSLLDRKALNAFNAIDERNRFLQGDIFWLGFKISFIPYKRLKRTIGKSQWTFSKKIKYFIDGLLNTSYVPIRAMSLIGVLFSAMGFLYALLIAYSRFVNNVPFKGYAPIMIIILISSGLIMIMLGIIGEYLWRTYDETRKRPLYIIKEKFEK